MYKRKHEDQGGDTPCEKKVAPIPRLLTTQSITLHFTNRSWEHIEKNSLYYLPICQNPKYMFDEAMKKQFNRFYDVASTFQIHDVKTRISNLIMLQDDVKIIAGTPSDSTIFTQVCYLLHFNPKRINMFFQLEKMNKYANMSGETLKYKLQPPEGKQLSRIEGFERFDKLTVVPARIGKNAGFTPGAPLTFGADGSVQDAYIAPDTTSVDFAPYSGNLQPVLKVNELIQNTDHITMAKNMDKISLYKTGDLIEIDHVTNLGDLNLLKTEYNNFLVDQPLTQVDQKQDKYTFFDEFCYPGPNRPYFSRHSNFDSKVLQLENIKNMKNLSHHFFCMPPIESGTKLIGQRCSFLVEQSMSVTLNFTESVFDRESADEMLHQQDAVIIRRNIYGTQGPSKMSRTDPFCGPKAKFLCKDEPKAPMLPFPNQKAVTCPANTWEGWDKFMSERTEDEIKKIFNVNTELKITTSKGPFEMEQFDLKNILKNNKFLQEYGEALRTGYEGYISILVKDPVAIDKENRKYSYVQFGKKNFMIADAKTTSVPKYVIIDMLELTALYANNGITCTDVMYAEFESASKDCTTFFC